MNSLSINSVRFCAEFNILYLLMRQSFISKNNSLKIYKGLNFSCHFSHKTKN